MNHVYYYTIINLLLINESSLYRYETCIQVQEQVQGTAQSPANNPNRMEPLTIRQRFIDSLNG